MFSAPKREEIDHLTIKFVVGLIAVTLAPLTDFFAKSPITSISASYYEGGPSQTIFIGFLFAIAALLLAYKVIAFCVLRRVITMTDRHENVRRDMEKTKDSGDERYISSLRKKPRRLITRTS